MRRAGDAVCFFNSIIKKTVTGEKDSAAVFYRNF